MDALAHCDTGKEKEERSTVIMYAFQCDAGNMPVHSFAMVCCRIWTIIFGAVLTCTMTFIPSFRHFRIYNIISLTGTAYTALYLIITACKHSSHLASLPKSCLRSRLLSLLLLAVP